MNFVCFLLLNAVLLLRPEELYPEITGLRLYLIVIVITVLLSLPELLRVLSPSRLRTSPVTVCVLLYYFACLLSLVVRGRVEYAALEFGPEFGKVVLYYLLLVAVIDTPVRFRAFVIALIAFTAALTGIALAQHYGYVRFDNIVPCNERWTDPVTGDEQLIRRLVSTGIFNDPNDLCLMLGLAIWGCVSLATSVGRGLRGLAWLMLVPLFGYALYETQSRGGLLGVLGGGAAYLYSRYGGSKSLPLMAVGGAVVLALAGGRQGSTAGGGTAHQRVMAWSDGLVNLFGQPLYLPTGLGEGWYVDESGLHAHNSFVQAYVEQGVIGGGAFLAAFVIGGLIIDRLGRGVPATPWAVAARPFTFAVVVGYAAGCYSITRNFVIPTYLVLGLCSAHIGQVADTLPDRHRVSDGWFARLALFAVVGLVAIKYATQFLGLAGV